MSMIEYTRCPKCGTLFDVSNIDFSDSKGWVQCGDCTHQFEAGKHSVNYSALLEQSILANMDEMSSSEEHINLGEMDADVSILEMNPVSVSEDIDLFDSPLLEDTNSDYVETEFESITGDIEEDTTDLDDAIREDIKEGKEDVKSTDLFEVTEELIAESDSILTEASFLDDTVSTFDVDDTVDDFVDLDDVGVESFWSKLLVASFAIPFLLALLLSFIFQLQKREIVDWIPESYQEPLQAKWLNFLDYGKEEKIDLSKIHLSSTKMESHPEIAGATMIELKLINRASINQSYPNLEISFTDGNGSTVARRILKPFDYLSADQLNVLESKQAKTLRLNLASMPEGAIGYEIQVTRGG